jgi:hypothetical protein
VYNALYLVLIKGSNILKNHLESEDTIPIRPNRNAVEQIQPSKMVSQLVKEQASYPSQTANTCISNLLVEVTLNITVNASATLND